MSLLLASLAAALAVHSQANPSLHTYFADYVGLTNGQISAIRSGRAVVKKLPSRTPDEVFVFGAVYIRAKPEDYLKLSRDFDRLRTLPGYLAINRFSDPPRLADLDGFTLDAEDIQALRNCKPGTCQIQMATSSIEALHQSIDFSAPDAAERLNRLLQAMVLDRLVAYQKKGSAILGEYDDKRHPTIVLDQFRYLLSYARALPKYLPDFYNYLLTYPDGKPANVEDSFYWAKVKFGLKPTLRVVHVVTQRGDGVTEPAYAIAEKQLYSSHYFETALDLTFCVQEGSAPQPGFYLIMTLGSEQAGLTGVKGSIIRKVAVDRSASSLEKSLTAIKNALEHGH